jgi:hypothetical protein
MDLVEIGRIGVDWIDLDQDRDQWRALTTLLVPHSVGKFLSRSTTRSSPEWH